MEYNGEMISKEDKRRFDYIAFLIGSGISTMIGYILFHGGYGWGISLAVGYALLLLVDIRKEVSRID